jgi:hypothetical protein
VAACTALIVTIQSAAPAQAQVSEGSAPGIIAIAAKVQDDSLLYLVDTQREVVLVYGFHLPGQRTMSAGVRTGVFEFLAGRLYRWDALLASKREYSIRGIDSLRGLRVWGPEGAKTIVEQEGR